MSLGHGPKIVTDGLVFAYDMQWNDKFSSKSYKGKPTINYAWAQNPRIDPSYSTYVYTTSGSWPTKHFDAITVYNKSGGNISSYVNTGVPDWTNTYHAHWVYDSVLKRPVTVMRNYDGGAWKAKYFNWSMTYADMGLTNGDTYTISWLQWTDNINRSANAGIYGTNTSGTNWFHDGQSDSKPTSYNTKPNTWQRVYATFTIAATNDLTTIRRCYMYGMYGGAGTLKIADVQIEAGVPSAFIDGVNLAASERTNTGVLLDWAGNSTITANSLTYNSDGTFSFNGTSDYIILPNNVGYTSEFSQFAWFKSEGTPNGGYHVIFGSTGAELSISTAGSLRIGITNPTRYVGNLSSGLTDGNWHYVGMSFKASEASIKGYIDGVYIGQIAASDANPTASFSRTVGSLGEGTTYLTNGRISSVKIYNRALTATEVAQNFQALKGRYGI